MIAGLVLASVLAPVLATHDPRGVNLQDQLRPPGAAHFFGTDSAGMDIFSRVLYGGRLALGSGLIILVLSTVTGSILGLLAGYFGGRTDEAIMRVTDVFLAFPGLILAMAVVAGVQRRSLVVLVVAIALRWWAPYARIMRAQTMAVSALEFAQAARASGAAPRRVLFRHILPNTISPIIVQATLDLGYVILTAASLSFIGFGVPPGRAGVGPHDRRRAPAHADRLVGHHVPRPGDPPDRARLQPPGRRHPGRAGPADARGGLTERRGRSPSASGSGVEGVPGD